jgi:cardiolipin synthase
VRPLVNGDEAFPALFGAIRDAQHHVHLQSFIIAADPVGRRLMNLLAQKAKQGVTVRLLFDKFGCSHALLAGLFRKYRSVPNLKMAGWTQANPIKRRFQVNLRNHRKIAVIDGHAAFCGGINLQDKNMTRGSAPPIQDYHFALTGPIVHELQYTFMRDWYFMTDEDPETLLTEAHFPHIQPTGPCKARVVNGEPTGAEHALADTFFTAIVCARKQVLAVTPYFVPPRAIVDALRSAALRGVDVRLLVPGRCNHVYAGLAGRALYDDLFSAGVRVFERHPPFMHAKALLVDSALALVGTANLDVRSLRLNYETNLAVFDDTFCNQLKRVVLNDFSAADEIAPAQWRRRPVRQRMVQNLAALLTPVL